MISTQLCRVLAQGELGPDISIEVGNDISIPSRETFGISKIAPLIRGLILKEFAARAEVPKKIHLLARVVLVDILAIPGELISRVLDAIETSTDGLFIDTDIVTQAPSEQLAVSVEVVRSRAIQEIERFHLAVTGVQHFSLSVDVGGTASRHDQRAVGFPRQKQSPRGVIRRCHVGHDPRRV